MTMRKFSKHTPEQIVVILEKAEALRGEGMSTAQACRVLGISEARLCRWRQRHGSMNRSEAKKLRELREQNALETVTGPSRAREGSAARVGRGKLLGPARRHEAVNHLVGQGFSQPLARTRCRAVPVSVLPYPRGVRGENAA